MSLCVTRLPPLWPIQTPIAPGKIRPSPRMMLLSTTFSRPSAPGRRADLRLADADAARAQVVQIGVPHRQPAQPRRNQTPYSPVCAISQSSTATWSASSAWTTAGMLTAACPSPCPCGGRV